jgi:hypothetical protein
MKPNKKLHNLIKVKRDAEQFMKTLPSQKKQELNLKLDVEHAYYSSALEGSKLDRKTFDELAKSAQ